MTRNSFQSSVHRLLATRLALVALVIGILFAAIAYVSEQQRIQGVIVDLARVQAQRFNKQALPVFDDLVGIDPVAVQAELDSFSNSSGGAETRDGRFVLARIYDDGRQTLAELSDPDFSGVAAVEKALDLAELPPLTRNGFGVATVRLAGDPFVGVALPMLDSSDEVVGQLVGVFAVSDDAVARIRGDLLLTILYVVSIVLITAAAVYPIIGGLLGRLAGTTLDLLDANLETMQVLGSAIAKRDSDTDAHNYRVSVYSVALAEAVGLPPRQIQSLIKGALLHDVGKLGIRDHVLLKPGRLDRDEFEIMKTHVEHGLDITARAKWLEDAGDVVGAHHEKFDGGGYPKGLARKDIPINARIFAIVDVFDALTSRRPYKEPLPFEETMQILEEGRETHFDPELLGAFATIAHELYREYGGSDGDRPRERLEEISRKYFWTDAADLMTPTRSCRREIRAVEP
jgi:HD-GYP domain-containing protein (c-di-GMP phosphodiesterase class II)